MNSGVAEASPKYLADVATNGIPVGYKQTEVGIIPEDWETKPLGELVEIYSGDSPSKFVFSTEGTPYFKVEQLNNGSVYADTTPYFIHSSKKVLAGSVIFPKRGASILSNKIRVLKYDSFMDTNLMALTCHHGLDELFLYNQLTYRGLDSVADTTSIPQINNKHISPYLVPLPRKTEQTAIANALSDVDTLISELEKLIAKKQAIKTATMQQLLTGRTRLPQFALREDGTPTNSSGTNLDAGTGGPKGEGHDGLRKGTKPSELGEIPEDWEVRTISELGIVSTGGTPSTSSQEFWNGDIPWITPTDITHSKNIFTSERKISQKGLQSIRQIPANSLLVTCIASIGKNAILRRDGACNQQINAVVPNEDIDVDFLFYAIELSSDRLKASAGITATLIVSKALFEKFQLLAPVCPNEQTAIATILSDMDAEIQALEQRLGKTRQIKQGMMQELLTGKTRLIKPSKEVIHE